MQMNKRIAIVNHITSIRKIAFWALVILSSLWMAKEMSYVLQAVEYAWLRAAMFLLFVSCFTWIAVPFWIATLGLILLVFRIDPLSLERKRPLQPGGAKVKRRTAVVMPVYNEHPEQVFAAMAAMYDDINALPEGDLFDFFILSDSRKEECVKREAQLWDAMHAAGRERLYYRRRENNTAKKAGNIEDFVVRWGDYYESMVVLDADSLMTAETIRSLALLMEANPEAGLIQTNPRVVFAETLFARLIQFACRLYGPLFSYGAAFWHGAQSNYWGHNAIVRIAAFRAHCGLGDLPGKPPLGGPILSHDFVEAALLSSAGWGVYMLPGLEGSYEQIPPTPIEYLQRDKRWSQGNLQHLKLLFEPELTISSRTFFLLGAFAYLSSPLWLLLLCLSTLDTVLESILVHDYFPHAYQLFPAWPISREKDAFVLFSVTAIVLFTPKIGGLILAAADAGMRRLFGELRSLFSSVILETVFFILFAPTMMMFHSAFVVLTLIGKRVPWDPQNRFARELSFREAFGTTWWICFIAVAWAVLLVWVDPRSLILMSPVLLGLLLAPLLIWISSSIKLGNLSAVKNLFTIPEERRPHALLQAIRSREAELSAIQGAEKPLPPMVPPERPHPMPKNPLFVPAAGRRGFLQRLSRASILKFFMNGRRA